MGRCSYGATGGLSGPSSRTSIMRITANLLRLAAATPLALGLAQASDLVITGVIDGPLTGGVPKAIELYATADIADLSIYGISSANNGGGATGAPEFALSGSATAGQFLYVASEETEFSSFFGFAPTFTSGAASINGDDAIELFENGSVVDVFGDVDTDGTGQTWEYMDGWIYRVSGTGPDGATFTESNWTFSGINALDGETTNASATTPFPIGTYDAGSSSGSITLTILHNNDGESSIFPDFDAALGTSPDDEFGGAATFVTLVDQEKAAATNPIMLSSGDNFLPGTVVDAGIAASGSGVVDYNATLINEIGYDALAIGNHEFDLGPNFLADFIGATSGVPFLSANSDFSAEAALQALVDSGRIAKSTILNVGGEQVGVIGAITEGLAAITNEGDVVVSVVEAAVEAEIAALQSAGVNKIILISHLQSINEELSLIGNISGVDVVIAGGGDEILDSGDTANLLPSDAANVFGTYPLVQQDENGDDVFVVTTPGNYRYLGRLVIDFDAAGVATVNGSTTSELVRNARVDGLVEDPDTLTNVVQPVESYISTATTVVCSEVPLDTSRPNIRTVQTNMGAISADSFRAAATAEAGTLGLSDDYILALTNGGGIRTDRLYPAGEVSDQQINNIFPFGNAVNAVTGMSAAQLKSVLEHAVAAVQNVGGQWGHISGFSFNYDPDGTAQTTVETSVDSGVYAIDTPGSRVKDVYLSDGTRIIRDGEVTSAGAALSFTLVVNSFILENGDRYPLGTVSGDTYTPYPNVAVTGFGDLDGDLLADYGDAANWYLAGLPDVIGSDGCPDITAAQYAPEAVVGRIVASASGDLDGDRIADAWEQTLIEADPNDAFASLDDIDQTTDFDNDGTLDLAEFNASEPGPLYVHGAFDGSASEIVSFDASTKRLFVTNSDSGRIDVLDATDPQVLVSVGQITALGGGAPTHVEVRNGVVAVSVVAPVKTDAGSVRLFDSSTLVPLGSYVVGALPDQLTFSENGQILASADEGEPNDDYSIDPLGSVSFIDFGAPISPANAASGVVTTVDFSTLSAGQISNAEGEGMRIFGPGATVAQDLEPEYVAFGANGKLYVVCQENNALAILDVATKTLEGIKGLGFKDWSTVAELDPSDRDGGIHFANWPIFGMYQPDGMRAYEVGGQTYLVTANEGDARDYDTYSEEVRVRDMVLDPTVFPDAATLQLNENLGRLRITNANGDTDGDMDLDVLYAYGARSFTIWDADGNLVWDSGDDLEKRIASILPANFNANNDDNEIDARSDDKGPEPEAIEIGVIGATTYAFVGVERVGGVFVYDITNPVAPSYVTYFNDRNFDADPTTRAAGNLGPEGLDFIPAAESPTGANLLAVASEVSGTTAVYDVDALLAPPIQVADTGFIGGDFFIDVVGGTAGRKVTSSDDLAQPFTDVSGVIEENDGGGQPNRFRIPAGELNPGTDFFRVEDQ